MDKKSKEKRDWLGDIFLWSFFGTIAVIILNALFDLSGPITAIPLVVFGSMCCIFLLNLFGSFIVDIANHFRGR